MDEFESLPSPSRVVSADDDHELIIISQAPRRSAARESKVFPLEEDDSDDGELKKQVVYNETYDKQLLFLNRTGSYIRIYVKTPIWKRTSLILFNTTFNF